MKALLIALMILCAAPVASQDLPDWAIRFKQDVAQCWSVGNADGPTPPVTIRFAMFPDGTPDRDSIQLTSGQDATDGAVQRAFDIARRAVVRCGAAGYDLPAEIYDQWAEIIITFDISADLTPPAVAQIADVTPSVPVWYDDFSDQIMACYDIGDERNNGTVVHVPVAFEMGPAGRVVRDSIRLVSVSETYDLAHALGFEAAQRAILTCGEEGYDLPLDLFSQWQFVEMSFLFPVPLQDMRPQARDTAQDNLQ